MMTKLKALSVLTGLSAALIGGVTVAAPANAAPVSASAATTSVYGPTEAAGTGTLSASLPAHTIALATEPGGTAVIPDEPGAPHRWVCHLLDGSCGWLFSHRVTVALYAGSLGVAVTVCHNAVSRYGMAWICGFVSAWVAAHEVPKDNQCLYVATIPRPFSTIEYLDC